ncbi:GFA family protein [Clavibacter sp. VKM Ac-2873]|nr:GFA family protein [Clavibacter sp. VKM Ac-2873]
MASEELQPPRLVWRDGNCHCGAVQFSVALTRSLKVTLCNCGICFKSGHQELMLPEDRFMLRSGDSHLKPYRFGNKIADHTFCAVCGIMPFYRPRSHPVGFFSVNARCVQLPEDAEVEYVEFDGKNWEDSMRQGLHRVTE